MFSRTWQRLSSVVLGLLSAPAAMADWELNMTRGVTEVSQSIAPPVLHPSVSMVHFLFLLVGTVQASQAEQTLVTIPTSLYTCVAIK